MAKVKYYYDSDTLSYRKIQLRKRDKLKKTLIFIASTALFALLIVVISFNLLIPLMRRLRRES